MARVLKALFATLVVGLAGGSAQAEPVKQLSHRDRLYDVTLVGNELYAVGHPGLLLRSSDAGKSFETVKAGQTDEALFSVAFNAKGQGAVVGRQGFYLTTQDQGKTWQKGVVTLGEEHPALFSVAVLDDGAIVAVGEFGAIVRSEDKGKTWTRSAYTVELDEKSQKANPSCKAGASGSASDNADQVQEARLTDVAFLDAAHGLVVGEFGLVLRTEDGGRTFKRVFGCTDMMLYSVTTAPGGRALAVGAAGTLVESSDGGQTWTRRESGTPEHLFGAFELGNRAIVTGAAGTALVREGAGAFKPVDTGVHGWLTAAVLDSKGQGVMVGGRGYVRRTADGGNTLQRVLGE
jgi:photosystem II stability/assembly factor-like uncharacterized protein